jgi:asparagine synthase (glutamine-hydrolysing)
VGLAHRRLSILDLSSNGHQPMSTPGGECVIVFNGEIYNYVEIKEDLEARGRRFHSGSDTEVLLQGYQEWGESVLDRCVGMFAFALWDQPRQTLFLARDRVGKKPLLYYWNEGRFAFASELKALAPLLPCPHRLDPQAVDAYLALGYVPSPLSIFRDIRKLPPGHSMTIRDGQMETRRYWHPEKAPLRPSDRPEERVEEYRSLMREAVRIRLRSDVPIGVFLSGGIDSSAVAAECVEQGQSLPAFTVTFDEDETDLPYAKQVAERLKLEHVIIHASGEAAGDDLCDIQEYYDEPFADTSNLPSVAIARAVHGQFKVVLNGDGGDEAFAGYRHYERVAMKQAIKRLSVAAGVKDGRWNNPWQVYFQSKAVFRKGQRSALMGKPANPDFGDCLEAHPYFQPDAQAALKRSGTDDALHRALWADRHLYLPDDLLYKIDIALMSQGIEGRAPFLDHRLMEWSQRLPVSDLVQGSSKKALLKKAYAGILPDEVLNRPKHGFGSPVRSWLKGPLRTLVEQHLPTPLFQSPPQETLLQTFEKTGTAEDAIRIWHLLAFALWAQRWRAAW